MEKTFSTGEAAEKIGRSPQHCKLLARLNGITVPKMGRRKDWLWSEQHVAAVKKLVDGGISK